jgi:ABC-type glutathione transport system ATPase component
MNFLLGIPIAILASAICRSMARSKNRNIRLWTIAGFVFPIVTVIVLGLLPALPGEGNTEAEQEFARLKAEGKPVPLLAVRDLRAFYGQVQALHGLSFALNEGTLTTLLGANGAGKTTTRR